MEFNTRLTPRTSEDGSALIMSMFIVIALSIVGAGMTVLSLSETYGSMNYRLMTQARYGAESAVHSAVNYLNFTYGKPGEDANDPLAAYTLTTSPVRTNGTPVILSSLTGVAANYPVAAVQTAFAAASTGSLVVGNENVQYSASATLVSMRQVNLYGVVAPRTIQTWLITGQGTTTGARNAQVEVTATFERQTVQLFNYAIFSTNSGCGSLTFSGSADVNSYDSQNIIRDANGNVVPQNYGGNVGSNGNLNESGGAVINGTMSTPRTGVGNCSAGGVNAWSSSGGATVTGGLINLPQVVTYPTPDPPNPMPPQTGVNMTKNTTCAQLGVGGCSVAVNPAGLALAPGSYGDVQLSGQAILHLSAGVYSINSLQVSGNSTIKIDSGPVVLNMGGQGNGAVVNLSGQALANASLDPRAFQIVYAGTKTITLSGGADSSGLVYAPNAPVSLSGGTDWFGAIIGSTFTASGGMQVHNDRQLANEMTSIGSPTLGSFSWKKY